jgi:RNA polymerase sigma-70 factor (ECF subfamily)
MGITDKEIALWVSQCLDQNRSAQEKLYKHFYPLFMPLCMSYVSNNDDAIDIYNRAFLKVFNSLHQFNDDGPLGGWIRRIIVNTAIDFLRKEKKKMFDTPIEEAYDQKIDSDALSQLTSNEILDLFRFLPPAQRLVLNLYIVEGYAHAEIAEELGISIGTSKWHLNQGRRLLQEKIYEFGILTK